MAEDRSKRWIKELDEVEAMSQDEQLAEARRIAAGGGFSGCVASVAIRLWKAARKIKGEYR